MSKLRSCGILFFAIGAMACAKPAASDTVATQETLPKAENGPAAEAPANEVSPPASPVRIVRQEGSFSYLAVDGDFLLRGMRFPERTGAFERVRIVDYNAKALGHSVGYNDPAGVALTVYLYGQGGNAEGELKRALGDMAAHPSAPPDLEFLGVAPFAIEIDGETMVGYLGLAYDPNTNSGSQAVVFSAGGRFLKFRITAPIEVFNDRMDEIRDVLLSFGRPRFER